MNKLNNNQIKEQEGSANNNQPQSGYDKDYRPITEEDLKYYDTKQVKVEKVIRRFS